MRRISLRWRLTLLMMLVFGVTTVVFSAWLFNSTMKTLRKDFDDTLYNYAVDVADAIDIGPRGEFELDNVNLDDGKILPFPLGTALIGIRYGSGKTLARVGPFGSFELPPPKMRELAHGEDATYQTLTDTAAIPDAEAESYRLINLPLDAAVPPQLILQIAVPRIGLEKQIAQRLALLQIGLPLVLLAALLGGLFIASRTLRPLRLMIATAKSVDASQLRQRVPVPASRDELAQLAQTFNEMLDRIEKAFASQERFIADASHQLLTPLSILKGELEMAAKSSDPAAIAGALASSRQEVDSLARVVQDMLLLARVDAGVGSLEIENIAVEDLLVEALRRCERGAALKSVRLIPEFIGAEDNAGTVRGDSDLLQNLLVNLIENAVKYSPPGEAVRLIGEWKSGTIEVRVMDRGPGIPAAELSRIFERFRRAPAAGPAPGFGLGLAIASKIANLHDARLTAENLSDRGALFRLELKKF